MGMKKNEEFIERLSCKNRKNLGFKSSSQDVYVKNSFKYTFKNLAYVELFNWNFPPLSQIGYSGEFYQEKAECGWNINVCFWQFTANSQPHKE